MVIKGCFSQPKIFKIIFSFLGQKIAFKNIYHTLEDFSKFDWPFKSTVRVDQNAPLTSHSDRVINQELVSIRPILSKRNQPSLPLIGLIRARLVCSQSLYISAVLLCLCLMSFLLYQYIIPHHVLSFASLAISSQAKSSSSSLSSQASALDTTVGKNNCNWQSIYLEKSIVLFGFMVYKMLQ